MNRNMRRGSGIPCGPLVTNHIRNLNEELESLQRRRELLQREQELLAAEHMYGRKRQYENNQPPRKFITYDTLHQATQSFSHLYDNGPGPNFDRGGPQPSKKRHTINVWDNTRHNTNQNMINQRPYVGPKPHQMSPPKPLMSIVPKPSIGRRISGFPSQSARKDFAPNKVTKPKFKGNTATKPSPGKKASYKMAIKSSTEGTKDSEILRADQVPSQQMTGRLELALGAILKDMKQDYCTTDEFTTLFHSKHIQRSIKQSIRERLRTVMLNKVVGRYVDIVATYRQSYPTKTDKEIVDTAILSTGSAEKHVRYNVNRLVTKKLDEMFAKLQQLYEGKDMEVLKIIESRPIDMDDKPQEKTETAKKIESDFYSSLVESLLEAKLPKLLPNYIDRIMKILDQDKEIKNAKELRDKVKQNPNKQSLTIEINDSETEGDVVEIQKADTKKEENNETDIAIDVNASIEPNVGDGAPENETDKDIEIEKSKDKDSVDESSIKANIDKPTEVVTKTKTNGTESVESQNAKPIHSASQYFVKVIGHPNLPNRNDAYKFLNQLKAVSIKKHKVVQNLLVVGFNTEEDFEKALAGSGTVVGNSKLVIKANDKQQLNTSTSSFKEDTNKNEEAEKNIITPELENQISDLLSTIRKADEEERPANQIKTEEIISKKDLPKVNANEIKKENTVLDNDSKEDSKAVEENTLQTNIYSPSNPYDEDSQGLEVIQENNDTNIEANEVSANITSTAAEVQGDGNDKEVKSNTKETLKGTPMRSSSRLSNVTPSTIRTRRASRLTQNN